MKQEALCISSCRLGWGATFLVNNRYPVKYFEHENCDHDGDDCDGDCDEARVEGLYLVDENEDIIVMLEDEYEDKTNFGRNFRILPAYINYPNQVV